jgi:AcrR family transcriptional regulator
MLTLGDGNIKLERSNNAKQVKHIKVIKEENTEKVIDRRIGKTRQVIQDALFTLMQEKQYNKITIQEIIDRANVGRSTFYSHFETKDDLLLSCIEHLLVILNQYIVDYVEMDSENSRLLPVAELFEHIKENSRLLKGIIKAESSELFFDKIQSYWNKSIENYLVSKLSEGAKPRIPLNILTTHITSTLINLQKWWVNNRMPYTSAQMDTFFQELVNPCIDSALGK